MGTKIVRNARPKQTFTQPAAKTDAPAPAEKRPPPPEDIDDELPPAKKKTKKKVIRTHEVKRRTRPKPDKKSHFSMTKTERTEGFGLYVCGNCRWFKEPFHSREKSCQDDGVTKFAMPCALNVKHHGYFEPKRQGKAKDVKIKDLDSGELMILAWRCRKAIVEKLRQIIRRFSIGDRVKFVINSEEMKGEIVRLTKRQVIIEPDDGTHEVRLKPADVELDEDPTASSL